MNGGMKMPTNPNVLVDREKYLGSSEISTIMGINPFENRYNLLLKKAGLLERKEFSNNYTEFGMTIEKYIRNYINKILNLNLIEDTTIVSHNTLDLRCNHDGLDKQNKVNCEIKSTSGVYESELDSKHYLVQTLYGAKLANVDDCILAIYERKEAELKEFMKTKKIRFNPEQLKIFKFKLTDYPDLLKEINEAIDKFLIDLEKLKGNPFLTEEDLLPKDLTIFANSVLQLESDVIKAKKIIEKYEEEKEKLRLAMINANVKKWETPNGIKITTIDGTEDVKINVFDEETFKKENKELFDKYQIKKIKKGRKGSLRITLPNFQK